MRDIFADTKAVIDFQVTIAAGEPDDVYVGARQAAAYVLRDGVTRDHRPLGMLGPDSEWEKRLFGGLPGQRWTNIHVRGADRLEHEPTVALVRTALSDEGFAAAWAAGPAMILEQAVARARADPDRADAVTMEAVLTSEGNRALLWNGPDDAAALIQREQPDVVILDLWMGACPAGWTILERLRREPATADIPVILCSGDVPVLVEQAPVLWARSCVTLGKPFSVDDLLATIDQAAFPRPERFVAHAA